MVEFPAGETYSFPDSQRAFPECGFPERDHLKALFSPIETDESRAAPDPPQLQPGMALCLSGGGYRAMLFHLGTLWRLNEAGLLSHLKLVSSVSGGSITAAQLGFKWSRLNFDGAGVGQAFQSEVAAPLFALASTTLDVRAVLRGVLGPGSVGDAIARAYDRHLFHGATLQDLPNSPIFVINATNVQSGVLWRFSKSAMADYRVGKINRPRVRLARAVAASSAFPPFLSPFTLKVSPNEFVPRSGYDLQKEPFTRQITLTDGGVYDNLGLEVAWKHFETIFVSDGGGKIKEVEHPHHDWFRHTADVLSWTDNQVRALRKRQLIGSLANCQRKGAYWGIWTHIADYGLASALPCPPDQTAELAKTPTRLRALDPQLQHRLVNWGYAVCDAALRQHFDPRIPQGQFPFPPAGVG